MNKGEYNNRTTGGPMCSYPDLSNYNQGQTHPPVPQGTPSMAVQLVYNAKPINYNALTHDVPYQCGGYHSIGSAYPDAPNKCTKQASRPCAGVLQ